MVSLVSGKRTGCQQANLFNQPLASKMQRATEWAPYRDKRRKIPQGLVACNPVSCMQALLDRWVVADHHTHRCDSRKNLCPLDTRTDLGGHVDSQLSRRRKVRDTVLVGMEQRSIPRCTSSYAIETSLARSRCLGASATAFPSANLAPQQTHHVQSFLWSMRLHGRHSTVPFDRRQLGCQGSVAGKRTMLPVGACNTSYATGVVYECVLAAHIEDRLSSL